MAREKTSKEYNRMDPAITNFFPRLPSPPRPQKRSIDDRSFSDLNDPPRTPVKRTLDTESYSSQEDSPPQKKKTSDIYHKSSVNSIELGEALFTPLSSRKSVILPSPTSSASTASFKTAKEQLSPTTNLSKIVGLYGNDNYGDDDDDDDLPDTTSILESVIISSSRPVRSTRNNDPNYVIPQLNASKWPSAPLPDPNSALASLPPVIPSYKFNLSSLLREKKKRLDAFQALEEALKDGDGDETFEGEIDAEEISNKVLSEETSDRLKLVLAQETIDLKVAVLDFFVHAGTPLPEILHLEPCHEMGLKQCHWRFTDIIVKHSNNPSGRKFLFGSHIILSFYNQGWACPAEIFSWCVNIVAFETQAEIQMGALCVVKKEISSKNHSSLTADFFSPTERNIFSVDILARILKAYGAPEELLKEEAVLEEHEEKKNIDEHTSLATIPLENFQSVVHLFGFAVHTEPQVYDRGALRLAFMMLIKCGLDSRVQVHLATIQSAISNTLLAFETQDWDEQIRALVQQILTSVPSMPLRAKIASLLSFICRRSHELRKFLSFSCLTGGDVEKSKSLRTLNDILNDREGIFKISNETDYRILIAAVTLLGFAVDDAEKEEKDNIVARELVGKLRHIHKRIVDSRAAFMDRTIAKDIIQRLYCRIYFSRCTSSAKQQGVLSQFWKKTTIHV